MQLRGVVLVEGTSDRRAVETLARRRGRNLEEAGVAVVPMGGYGNLPRVLEEYRGVRLAGLYDVGEERHFLRALGCEDRRALEDAGFYACTRDLEDELTRAVGPDGMERVLAEQGELRAFRTYQKQLAHRDRPLEEQLHGFMWNRKQRYAVLLVEALDLERVPRPLDGVLARFHGSPPQPHVDTTMGYTKGMEQTYSVPGMSCAHCEAAVKEEVEALGGVASVDVDLAKKLVIVRGDALDDAAVRAAIEDAGYTAA